MTIKDVSKKGVLNVVDIFKYSSNVGTYKIAEKVGPERLYETIRKFGFGESPGLGLIEEAKGSVSSPSTWHKTRFANISFGYGLMATSLQLLMMASTIANDGVLVPPKLFERNDPVSTPKRVLSEKAARHVKDLMFADTESGGTGKKASIQGVDVAGKTGTAEKVDPATGRYSKEHNLSSFVGFAPVNSPEVVAIVVIDEPHGIAYGGYVAAPAWQRIVSTALIRLGVIGAGSKDKGIHETGTVAQRKRLQVVAGPRDT
jgi:cell division protein FtsI (penicillin-binding protein 3)